MWIMAQKVKITKTVRKRTKKNGKSKGVAKRRTVRRKK